MAEDSKKLDFRDMTEKDGETYLTKSNAQLDLERRLDPDYKPDSQIGGTVTVNPNPFGADAYVGTDPIYQNYSTDQNKPFEAEEGPEGELLKAYKEEHDLDGQKVAEDYGLGGEAPVAETGTTSRLVRTILPGQEGYDLKKAEEQNGPPLRVFGDESNDEGDEDEVVRADNVGTNMGASTQPPEPPENPSQPDARGGNAFGTKDDASTSAGDK